MKSGHMVRLVAEYNALIPDQKDGKPEHGTHENRQSPAQGGQVFERSNSEIEHGFDGLG